MALLTVVTVLVPATAATGSRSVLLAASLAALACGWAAAGLVHRAVSEAMRVRVGRRDRALAALAAALGRSQRRAIEAEARERRESLRAAEAQARLQELSERLRGPAAGDPTVPDAVLQLLAWEERVTATATAAPRTTARRA